jgi:hypothetical protein
MNNNYALTINENGKEMVVDIRTMILAINFLLKKQGYENILEMDPVDFLKIVNREEKIKDILDD